MKAIIHWKFTVGQDFFQFGGVSYTKPSKTSEDYSSQDHAYSPDLFF